jgi:PAS domain S-box-containing protein
MTPSGESAPELARRYRSVASTAARAYLCFGVFAVVLSSVLGGSNVVHGGFAAGTAPPPSAFDAVFLGGDLLLILSMAWLVLSAGGKRDLGSLLDASLLALMAGVCGWVLFAANSRTSGSIAARFVSIAYPVADLIALALLVGLVFIRRRAEHRPSLPMRRALVLGLGLVAVPVAMVVRRALGAPDHGLADELALVVITAGVVLRGGLLVWELERLRHKAEQSERKFRLVFERAPIGISIGTNGIMSETNPALQRMLGYTSSEFAKMHYTDVTHPDDQDSKQQLELDAGMRDAFAIDKRYRRSDGSYIEAHVNVALAADDGLGISLVEDVTGRRELEDQLRQAQKMDSIGKLAGGIAHDFNNLMTAVMGYSDLLLREAVGPDRDKVDAIRDSAVRASDLTRQLLAFSRRQIMLPQEIDLRAVVERMDTLLRRLIGDDVHLQTLFGADPVIVRADKTQLEQVVMNLAVNARDAMPGGGTLTIAVLSDGATAVLSVVDDGIGMDEETLAQIFEPFFTTKSLAESSGLGLSTVHGIVGQSGGTVDVDSEPGQGTTFTVRLPVAGAAVLPGVPAPATLVD